MIKNSMHIFNGIDIKRTFILWSSIEPNGLLSANESVLNKKETEVNQNHHDFLCIIFCSSGLNKLYIKAKHNILNSKMVIPLLTHVT